MSVETFALKVGDTAPALTVSVPYSDGSTPVLVGATATFAMRDAMGNVVIPEIAATIDSTAGTVSYAWQSGQTDVPGRYDGEFTLNVLGSGRETHPSVFYVAVQILPSVGDRPIPVLPLIFDGSWLLDGTYALNGRKVPI